MHSQKNISKIFYFMLQLTSASENRRNTKLDESICPSLYFNYRLIACPGNQLW